MELNSSTLRLGKSGQDEATISLNAFPGPNSRNEVARLLHSSGDTLLICLRSTFRERDIVGCWCPCPEHRMATGMAGFHLGKSMAIAMANVTMLETVLAITIDPVAPESRR